MHNFKAPPYKGLMNYKRKMSKFSEEKPSSHPLKQETKVNIITIGTKRNQVLPCNKKALHHNCDFLVKGV